MTLNGVMAITSPNRGVMSPNSVAFWTDYVKVVEDTLILSAVEM